jgi:hypothetical protein
MYAQDAGDGRFRHFFVEQLFYFGILTGEFPDVGFTSFRTTNNEKEY